MLVTHPGLEIIAPALLLNRVPAVAVATRAVCNALDHEHRSHLPFSGIASLLPSTTADVMNGWQTSYRLLFAPNS